MCEAGSEPLKRSRFCRSKLNLILLAKCLVSRSFPPIRYFTKSKYKENHTLTTAGYALKQ